MPLARWATSGTSAFKAYRRYSDTWDHDHCEFCFAKFVPEHQLDKHRHAPQASVYAA